MEISLIIITFEYKSKLLGNTEADGTNGILKNETIVSISNAINKFQRNKCNRNCHSRKKIYFIYFE